MSCMNEPDVQAPELLGRIRRPGSDRVLDALEAAGGEGRFVGGCVRDALLDRPLSDIDIATPLKPEAVAAALEAAGIKAIPTGLKHGTITAVADHNSFEITTLRLDVETDGRHATVAFTGDWRADAGRLVLTHLVPWNRPADTLSEAAAVVDEPTLASAGLVIDL